MFVKKNIFPIFCAVLAAFTVAAKFDEVQIKSKNIFGKTSVRLSENAKFYFFFTKNAIKKVKKVKGICTFSIFTHDYKFGYVITFSG
jgi:hypothetical protein